MRMRQAVLAAVAAASVLAGLSVAMSAGPASAAAGNGCPASKTGVPVAANVTASVSNAGNVSTYQFSSIKSESPSGGIPGLMSYCVYPSGSALPAKITPQVKGANGANWTSSSGSNNFAFVRPGGDPSNIPLDGASKTMGTATWKALPASQAFVLHINDPSVCASLYGAGSSATCYVTPVPPAPPAPCSKGDSNVAYNSMPSDVVNCVNPAIGFEAQSASEFGNEVNLTGTARNLSQLKVDFQSFACQTGHWNGVPGDPTTPEPCAFTDPSNPTFQWPIAANIYDPGNLTTPIATTTVTQTIPYRPAADTTGHCTGPSGAADAANRWWNPAALGGAGACQSSIGTVLTFTFPSGIVLPNTVVWTVSFNTSDFGQAPQRPQACNTGTDANFPGLADGGCPYDSLNVGDNGNNGGADFPASHITGAPYAGGDTNPGVAFINQGSGLQLQSSWDGLRPLGEIIAS